MEPLLITQPGNPVPSFRMDDTDTVNRLKHEFKLTPEQLRIITEQYGPLDWRLAESHAIYWAHAGLATPTESRQKAMCRRIVYQCMSTEFFQGKLVHDPATDTYIRLARLDLLDKTIATYAEADRVSTDGTVGEPAALFMLDAVRALFAFGQTERAETLYARLRTIRPELATAPNAASMMAVEPQLRTRHANGCEPTILIEATLRRANAARRSGNAPLANALDEEASEAWHRFADRLPEPVQRRMDIPPFDAFRKAVLATDPPPQ
jgi:hypothetical protein